MSYVLINGTRYYKDDITGEVTPDDVSQEEADRRAQQYGGTYTPPRPDPPKRPAAPPASAPPRPARTGSLLRLFHAMVRGAAAAVAVCSVLLISAYCVKEPVQFCGTYHFELRDTAGIAVQLERVADRLSDVLILEGRNEND